MSLDITVQPTTEPIDLATALRHLKVDGDDGAEDDYIQTLIVAVREYCEELQGRAYITRTYELYEKAASEITLSMAPLQAVTAVAAYDEDNVLLEALTLVTDYRLVTTGAVAVVIIENMPSSAEYIKITYTAGYGSAADDVPKRTRQAMLLLLGHWYQQRQAVGAVQMYDVPQAFDALIGMDRLNWGAM
jgi:uncharacterized phiE125 gp8 family phage protein